MARQPPLDRSLVRIIAFLGRYGHQPASEVMGMTYAFASQIMDEVAEIMNGERVNREEE